MRLLSATDLAIAVAARSGALRVTERPSRFGGHFAAIEDGHGIIEAHVDLAAAQARIAAIEAWL